MCDACLQLKRKVQKYKADVLGGARNTTQLRIVFLFRNRPIEITVTDCQSILSMLFESCPREG